MNSPRLRCAAGQRPPRAQRPGRCRPGIGWEKDRRAARNDLVWFRRRSRPGLRNFYCNIYDQIVLNLRAGRIEASIGSVVAWQSPQYNPDEMLEAFGPYIDGRMFPEIWGPGRGIGIREGDTELRDRFNSAIRALYERDDIQELSEQWFGGDY